MESFSLSISFSFDRQNCRDTIIIRVFWKRQNIQSVTERMRDTYFVSETPVHQNLIFWQKYPPESPIASFNVRNSNLVI